MCKVFCYHSVITFKLVAIVIYLLIAGRPVEGKENLKNYAKISAKLKKKKKKKGQYKENIKQVCVKEFYLGKEEILISLKKALDNRILLVVNKNKISYRTVQEIHVDEKCIIDSQIDETLENIE